jgi:putative ABC transport system substrate-binding protein
LSDRQVSRSAAVVALALSLAVLAAPLTVEAQSSGKVPWLCFLTFDSRMTPSNRLSSSPASPVQFDPFFKHLRDLGYVDGQTITIDYLSADGQGERFPALAAECLRLKADIVVVTTTPAAKPPRARPARSRL